MRRSRSSPHRAGRPTTRQTRSYSRSEWRGSERSHCALLAGQKQLVVLADWGQIRGDFCALVASVPFGGWSISILARSYRHDQWGGRDEQKQFLDELRQIVPRGCRRHHRGRRLSLAVLPRLREAGIDFVVRLRNQESVAMFEWGVRVKFAKRFERAMTDSAMPRRWFAIAVGLPIGAAASQCGIEQSLRASSKRSHQRSFFSVGNEKMPRFFTNRPPVLRPSKRRPATFRTPDSAQTAAGTELSTLARVNLVGSLKPILQNTNLAQFKFTNYRDAPRAFGALTDVVVMMGRANIPNSNSSTMSLRK